MGNLQCLRDPEIAWMGYSNNEEQDELYLERKVILCVTFDSGRIWGSVQD